MREDSWEGYNWSSPLYGETNDDFYALTYRRIPSIRILLESFVSNESMKLRCPAVLIDRVRGYESIVCQNIGRSRKALELGLGAGPHWHGLYLLLCVTSYW